ncbi:hypothetical protein CFP65_0560 [Kitasatospora sp. MMS16-BH015]|uniref:hypothetical protein n=1 Tax=Kitasatospora sp. MMS16-BH015 TaxID=2018025 RepID=UPI000CA198CC|nr:hypothetical protein [Kitasatospora sp. MMS16-BH015]AUG75522.1 hypothetical protein CFP65_0560 [Kitasatospora sp. MMS16-BH015]
MNTTWIDDAEGQTHTGSGNQYNINNSYFFDRNDRFSRAGDPLRVAIDERRWLSERFVPPSGYGDAVERFEEGGTAVLLSGARGCGRRTAAVVLLHHAGRPEAPFREAALDDPPVSQIELAQGERVFIDLTAVPDQRFAEAQQLVQSYREKTERVGGRLAVAAPRDRDQLLLPALRALSVSIDRPDGARVLAKHLTKAGLGVSPAELRRSALDWLLDPSPMRDLQRLAELVLQARSRGGAFEQWAERASEALQDRGLIAAQKIAALESGHERALLFAAAMLEETPADIAFLLYKRLLTSLRHPEEEAPRLDRADLSARLTNLGISVVDGRIRFDGLAFGAAVRSHLWLYYPDLRGGFRAWVTETVQTTTWLDGPDRGRLVARLTEQCLHAGEVTALGDLVADWAKHLKLLPLAMAVLEQSLRDEQRGAEVRAQVYLWATSSNTELTLVRGLARVCVDVIAPYHPDQALVRLHQLARREPDGPRYARASLFELVEGDRRLYRRLLVRLAEGMELERPWRRDALIFLALVATPPPEPWYAELVRCWRGPFVLAAEWSGGVESWLAAARLTPARSDRLLDVLIEAADGRSGVLSRCYLIAERWARQPEVEPGLVGRREVARRFRQKIDRAQGIEPFEPTPAGAAEEERAS